MTSLFKTFNKLYRFSGCVLHYTVPPYPSLPPPPLSHRQGEETDGRGRKLWVNAAQRGATAPAVFIPDSPGKTAFSLYYWWTVRRTKKQEKRPKQRLTDSKDTRTLRSVLDLKSQLLWSFPFTWVSVLNLTPKLSILYVKHDTNKVCVMAEGKHEHQSRWKC